MTRVRVSVKNPDHVDREQLNKINGVMKVLVIGKQFQIVVGGIVNEVYDAVIEIIGDDAIQSGNVDELIEEDKELIEGRSNGNEKINY